MTRGSKKNRGVAAACVLSAALSAGAAAAQSPPTLLPVDEDPIGAPAAPPTEGAAEPSLEDTLGGLGAETVVIDPRTGQPRFLNEPPPESESDRRARARLRDAEGALLEGEESDAEAVDPLDASILRPGAPIPESAPPPAVPGQRVVLRGLDKLNGDLGEAEAAVGETAALWRLEIDVKACYARPEAGSSDASAFLQIRDTKPDPAETVFSGWMFAASPALSAMDHPRYDVWVLSCSISEAETPG